jgi:drug/metabolite transporter (DMT)-like permease
MNKTRSAPLYGFAVAILWGLSFLSIKVAVVVVPPMTMAVARFVIACAVLPLFAFFLKERLAVAWRDVPVLALGGIFGVTIYFYCENNAVALLTASESSIIVGTIPVVTMLAERIFIGTRLGLRSYGGALLSFAGVALIVGRSLPSGGGSSSPLGYILMAGAGVAWVAYTFATKGVARKYGMITVTFWQSLTGLAGCIPFALAEAPRWQMPGLSVSLNVVYLGLFCSAAGYWLYASALNVLGVGKASVFVNLIPVVSVVAAFFILGERLGALQWAGGAVAIAGVYLATVAPRQARAAA